MDFEFHRHGSLYTARAVSEIAKEHAAEVYADATTFGGRYVIESRYVVDNVTDLLNEGLRVSVDGQEIELR